MATKKTKTFFDKLYPKIKTAGRISIWTYDSWRGFGFKKLSGIKDVFNKLKFNFLFWEVYLMRTEKDREEAQKLYNETYRPWAYGTDKSYFLEQIQKAGFNPIGITVMACEETIIFKTKEESHAAWEKFKPEGWWYGLEEWPETRKWYVNRMYDGKENEAPIVYWLN